MRLCFGSFVVAILVGAFNRVTQKLALEEKDRVRNYSLPDEYVFAGDRSPVVRVGSLIKYIFTGVLFDSHVPRMRRAVEEKVHHMELDGGESAGDEQLMLSSQDAEDLVGVRVAARLIERYGAKRQVGDERLTV